MRNSALIGAVGLSITMGAAPQAAAQIPGFKPLWSELRSQLASEGWTLTTSRLVGSGDVWRIEGVQLDYADGRDQARIVVPALGLERSDTSVTLFPEGVVSVAVTSGQTVTRFEIRPEGEAAPGRDLLRLSYDGAEVRLVLHVEAQSVHLVEGTRAGAVTGDRFEAQLAGISLDGRAALAAPYGGDLVLDVRPMSYAFASGAQGALQEPLRADFSLGGFMLRLHGSGIPDGPMPGPELAFAQGLRLVGQMGLHDLAATVDMRTMGMPIRSTSALTELRIELGAEAGRFDGLLVIGGVNVSVEEGPLTGAVGLQEFTTRLGLPLVQTPEPVPFESVQALRELTVSPGLLELARLAPFGDLPLSVETRLLGDLRWLRSLDQIEDSDVPPVDLTRLQGMLGAALGPNTLDVQYDLTLPPGAIARMDDDAPPEVAGTARIELRGGSAVLDLVARTGLVPPAELGMARMVMGGLSRPIGDDHLLSEIEFQPGGTVLINGLPAPF